MTPTEQARKALEEATRATIIAHLAKYVSREDDGSDEPAEGSDFCGYLTFDGLDNLSAALAPQETPGPSDEWQGQTAAEMIARKFHDTYERKAPAFGYETRTETREFDPTAPNGRLMMAVCAEVGAAILARWGQSALSSSPETAGVDREDIARGSAKRIRRLADALDHGKSGAEAEISRLRAALERFVKNEQSLAIDLMTAHRGRGDGVSSAMREDDADLRDELTVACAAIRDFLAHTALQPEQPALAKLDGATTTQTGGEHGVDTLTTLLSQASTAGLYCTVGHTPPSDVHRTPPAPERRYSAHVSGRKGSTDAEAATLVDALRDALAAYEGAR